MSKEKFYGDVSMEKSILLITTILPCRNYSGGIILEQITKYLLDDNYDVFLLYLKNPNINEQVCSDIVDNLKIIEFPDSTSLDVIIKKSIQTVEMNQIEKIFLGITRPNTLKIVKQLYKDLGIPYYIFSGDPLEWILKYTDNSKKEIKQILNLRKNVFSNAKLIFCGSSYMAKLYEKIFKTNTLPLYASYTRKSIMNNVKLSKKTNNIIIGFSGQTYAKDAISAFIKCLDEIDWTYKNSNIILKYYGNSDLSFVINDKNKKRISIIPWLSQENLIEELNKCDYLYCPYFFSKDPVFKSISKLSFPSKLVTYLVSSRRLIIHAPKYSSVYKFLKKYTDIEFINTIKIDKIKIKLFAIFNQNIDKLSMYNNYNYIYQKYFEYSAVKRNFLNGVNDEKD